MGIKFIHVANQNSWYVYSGDTFVGLVTHKNPLFEGDVSGWTFGCTMSPQPFNSFFLGNAQFKDIKDAIVAHFEQFTDMRTTGGEVSTGMSTSEGEH